jgi:S-adenosylmethionine decarboxylase
MTDLAPSIFRQRLVIEGLMAKPIDDGAIRQYLKELSPVLDMHILNEPVTHKSPKFGWSGWVHWETSGAHFYAWEQPVLFFSVDIYTCKEFAVSKAVDFTQAFFKPVKIAHGSFLTDTMVPACSRPANTHPASAHAIRRDI